MHAHKFLRALADSYESIQAVRITSENRIRAMEQDFDETEPVRLSILEKLSGLKDIEADFQKDMERHLKELPIWNEFLKHIRGIGPTLAAKLLAFELDPKKNLTAWNAFFGLTPHYWIGICEKGHKRMYAKDPLVCQVRVREEDSEDRYATTPCNCGIVEKEHITGEAPRRKAGHHSFWNPRARTLTYLISKQFLLGGRFYKEQYYKFKDREKETRPDVSDGRRHNSAMRKTVQLFLAHLYQATNELQGLTPRIPYSFEYLNHSEDSFIHWKEVVAYDKVKSEKKKKAA